MSNEKSSDVTMEFENKNRPLTLDNLEKNDLISTTKTTNLNESIDESTLLSKQMSSDLNVKHDLKFRENLYRLIISQLFYDGYQNIAVALSGTIQVRNLYHLIIFNWLILKFGLICFVHN